MSRRLSQRPLQFRDLVPRFESAPLSHHVRNAVGHLQRLKSEGRQLIGDDAGMLSRWDRACDEMLDHIGRLGNPDARDLATAMRELIHAYEHATTRIDQMLHGFQRGDTEHCDATRVLGWFEHTYRLATYAVMAAYCEDKRDETTVEMNIRVDPDDPVNPVEIDSEIHYTPERGNPKYKHAKKRL